MRIILFEHHEKILCANFDNDDDAQNLLNSGVPTRELPEQEIIESFGDSAQLAGDEHTRVEGADILTAKVNRVTTQDLVEYKRQRKAEIQKELTANDLASVRPLRAKVSGTATAEDEVRLRELEEQAQALRAELSAISAA